MLDHSQLSPQSQPKLRLVISNPSLHSVSASKDLPLAHTIKQKTDFTVEVFLKDPYLYWMAARDSSHGLSCNLPLEIEENEDDIPSKTLICHFSKIDSETTWEDLREEDEILSEMMIMQFQMKIWKHLLSFCLTNYVSQLLIYTDQEEKSGLGIYYDFLSQKNYHSSKNNNSQISVPITPQILEDWNSFMKEVTLKLQQTLWREQRFNQTIRDYLKAHPFTNQ